MAPELHKFPIENYRLVDVLGQGAHGTVSLYEISDRFICLRPSYRPHRVAVKIFQPNEEDKFSRELEHMVKVAADEVSPNIVKCYGTCKLPKDKLGLVMELFDSDLMQFISPPCNIHDAKVILKQMAVGLRRLKELDIVHRDIKPDNVLVRRQGDGTTLVALTDLGVSKHMTRTQKSHQTNIGTDLWMAPEVKGDSPTYGHPADVYGFGLTMLYVLTGNFPLGRDVTEDQLRHWIEQCLLEVRADKEKELLGALVRNCMEYDPTKRIRKNLIADHRFFQGVPLPVPVPISFPINIKAIIGFIIPLLTLLYAVLGGFDVSGDNFYLMTVMDSSVQVISIDTGSSLPTCLENLRDAPFDAHEAAGAVLSDGTPLICTYNGTCFKYDAYSDSWYPSLDMSFPRSYSGHTHNAKMGLVMAGGYNYSGYIANVENTIDGIKSEVMTPLPKPQRIYQCLASMDDDTLLLTGGSGTATGDSIGENHRQSIYYGEYSRESFKYSSSTMNWTKVADMSLPRERHSCGVIDGPNAKEVLVVGGFDGQYKSDTEIYNIANGSWRQDTPFPTPIGNAATVELDGTLLVVGGSIYTKWGGGGESDKIYKYVPATRSWELLPMRLKHSAAFHVAIMVPASTFPPCPGMVLSPLVRN